MRQAGKLFILGLDSADPKLAFDTWRDRLPTLRALCDRGLWGRLESSIPPLTVPAWSCMASGLDPGQLGVYGFRHRPGWTYDSPAIATNLQIDRPRLWDHLSGTGRPSVVLGVPQTYPIVNPPAGCLVSCFLTPTTRSRFTHPPELADEIRSVVGEYILDAEDTRSSDRAGLLARIQAMAEQRFRLASHLVRSRSWDLFWMVDMGVDRIQHAFWRDMEPLAGEQPASETFTNAIRDYYEYIDRLTGDLLATIDADTAVMVVSDHGAQRLDGSLAINDWLITQGLLVMKSGPGQSAARSGSPGGAAVPRRFDPADVDWSRTSVWAEGGYTASLYLNRAGREPQGILGDTAYERVCAQVTEALARLSGPDGQPLANQVLRSRVIYREQRGHPPDLVALLGNLRWRAVGSLGHPSLFVSDRSPTAESANHAQHGLYILRHPAVRPGRRDASLLDIAPTALRLLGLPVPAEMSGSSLLEPPRTA